MRYCLLLALFLTFLQACNQSSNSTANNTTASATPTTAAPAATPELPPTPAPTPALTGAEAELWAKAMKIHQASIVIDTHNDVTSAILDDGFDLAQNGIVNGRIKTHTDIARLKAGGMGAQFFAVYVGKEFVGKKPEEGGGAARRALDMIGVVYDQVKKHPETFEMAYTADDIRRIRKAGKIAALMGIEGGHAIEDSIYALRNFHRLGIRYMTLTHTNTNNWADSEADLKKPNVKHHGGLNELGKKVILEMNKLGMMVDISHVSDETMSDVFEISKAPVIASHSSARAIANHTRNLNDDELRAIKQNGGVVMVNFYDGFIDPKKAEVTFNGRAKEEELKQQFPNDPKRVADELKQWRAQYKFDKTPLSVLLDHIEHIIKVAGIDHVGLGADLDGIGLDATPVGLEDVSQYPVLTYELLKRGHSEADIKKILGENLLRAMARCEQVAKERQTNAK